MSLKLYYDLMSQPSRALYILLKSSNVPFENCPVALRKGEHFSDEYKKIHRFNKVPAIDDDGFKLIESVGILRYLAREKNLPDFWYPKNSTLQARVDEYMEWQHHNTRAFCALYFQVRWLQPLLTGKQPTPERVEKYETKMSDCLDVIENEWLNKVDYLVNNQFSAADLWAACEIEQVRIVGYEPTNGRPALKAWLERVKNKTNPHYDEAHSVLKKMTKATAKMSSNL